MATAVLGAFAGLVGRRLEAHYGPPVIIIGMHRSGTSLVARLLRGAGGYFGSHLESNSESIPFIVANNTLLGHAGMRWYSVEPEFTGTALTDNDAALWSALRSFPYLQKFFFSNFGQPGEEVAPRPVRAQCRRGGLLSPLRAFGTLSPANRAETPIWGWKDPRSSLTLGVWLKIFPHARVIHVIRDGTDCALSLWRRSTKGGRPQPCTDLEYCYDLWNLYTREALEWRRLGASRYREVRYEQLLQSPVEQIGSLLEFVDVNAPRAEQLQSLVDTSLERKNHGACHPELYERAAADALRGQLGYV